MAKKFWQESGFSLIEVLVVIALLSVVLVFVTVNLFSPNIEAKMGTVSTDIVSITREAQNKAMNTDTQGDLNSDEFGVHFETSRYILFKGSSFDGSDPNNFVVNLENNLSITPSLPCPSPPGDCNNIVFQRISGEVQDYDQINNSVCLSAISTSKDIIISFNFVGVTSVRDGC